MPRFGDGVYQRGETWWLDFRHRGERHVERLGAHITETVAREIARVKRAAILRGEAGIGKKRKDLSFDDARKKFEAWAEATLKPRTVESYKECLRRLAKSFGERRLSELSPFLIERHKQARIKAGARVRANRELAVGKRLVNLCLAWRLIEGDNPFCAVKRTKEPQQRLRFLEADEERRLVDLAPSPLKEMVIVAINTGLRVRAEALTLRWADVDFRRKLLTVQAAYAKNGRNRTIPLNPPALDALTSLRARAKGDIVFSKPNGKPYREMEKPFRDLVRSAGLAGTGISLHTLRHTFASRLVLAGVDLRTVQELGGWSDLSMVQRYTHVAPDHKAEAVRRIWELFPNAIHNTRSGAVSEIVGSH